MVTPKAPIPRKRLITAVGLTAFLLALTGASFYFYSSRSNTPPKLSQMPASKVAEKGASNSAANPTNNSQVNQAAANTPFTLAPRSGLKPYVSQNSKVGFYFKPNPGNTQFDVKEAGNKITVFETSNPNINQHLEIFPKNPSDTIEQAITNSVLSGYSSSDCPIKVQSLDSHFPSSYTTAVLNYSPDNQTKNGWGVADTSKCPVAYTINYDNKLFVVDNNHPDRLVFFNLGQFTISAGQDQKGNTLSWHDTLTFF